MRPPFLRSSFFSSLKQVEKRLKLDSSSQQSFNFSPPPANTEINGTLSESLSTPMYIYTDQEPNGHCSTALQESSEPPLAFLLSSSQNSSQEFPQEQPSAIDQAKSNGLDDIDLLIQLLGLSDFDRENKNQVENAAVKEGVIDECCRCESGFYEKIVGVKGPKCKKEVKRLDGWIRCLLHNVGCGGGGGGGEGRLEPLRLAYLLLGKASFELELGCDGNGLGGLEFPLAIEEFLKHDPQRE